MLDTGADVSILSRRLTQLLGLKLHPSKERFVLAADGMKVESSGKVNGVHLLCGTTSLVVNLDVFDLGKNTDLLIGRDLDAKLGIRYCNIPTQFPDQSFNLNKSEVNCYSCDSSKEFFELKAKSEFSKQLELEIKTELVLNSKTSGKFCSVKEAEVTLDTGSNKPLFINQYQVKRADRETVDLQVKKWFDCGVTMLSEVGAAWNSSLLVVPKKDLSGRMTGKRVCLDARPLNNVIPDDKHPLPKIRDIFEMVSGHRVFSKLDLAESYHQFPLRVEDRVKTSFFWGNIHYMFKGTPFGIKTVTSVFQRVMSRLLMQFPFAVAYVDDILVFSDSEEEHISHVKLVLEALTAVNLTVKVEKCQFGYGCLELLGHEISAAGIRPTEEKLKSVEDFPRPKSGRDVQSFLGLTNYLRDYIPLYAAVTYPLERIRLVNVISDDVWSKECEEAFVSLKKLLREAPIIKFPDFDKDFYLATDASDYGIGAVLFQYADEAKTVKNFVGMVARALSSGERNYSVTQRELVAIVFALQRFCNYLEGRKFTVITDHRALIFLHTQKEISKVVARWYEVIIHFDFDVEYCPGVLNKLPDLLSRLYPDFVREYIKEKSRQLLMVTVDKKENAVDAHKWREYFDKMLFNFGCSIFGECSIEVFAFESANVLARSASLDGKGCGSSCALSISWANEEQVWVNTPVMFIDQVVDKVKVDKARALVVTPYVGRTPWFERLLRLCHEQPVAVDIHSNLYVPGSLANFQDTSKTPWRLMLLWPISARQDAHRVVVNGNVATWERYKLGSHGIFPSKNWLRVLIDKVSPPSNDACVAQLRRDGDRDHHGGSGVEPYSFGDGMRDPPVNLGGGESVDNAAAVITEHIRVRKRRLGHGSQPVSKHERVIDSSVKSGH